MSLSGLKKHIFFEFLNLAGRAYVLARYSEDVILGNRGFTPEEKENGIILVFNSRMNFQWDEYGITATLVFGTSPQKCFVPVDDIIAVYSPDLSAQFVLAAQPAAPKVKQGPTEDLRQGAVASKVKQPKDAKPTENVIKVDFTKKTKPEE